MTPRAPRMQPEDRRAALISATRSLLYVHGRNVTTRLIAEAAGVAEGTIFGVFGSKDELVEAAISDAFKAGDLPVRVREIDPALPLRQKLVAYVSALQQRYLAIFGLMATVGMMSPPEHDREEHEASRRELRALLAALLEPEAAQLRQPVAEVVHLVNLLTFSASHSGISDGRPLTPEQIVDALLHGVLLEEN
ncbi:TetR/AcrR family transcriptional regulator [Nocardioides sp. InS609-2]|uniref:TetR/AcrR family transcriptional regulator n=1 Tax=Nocardioides sp. InS609-2 TaxID=2760705 RepID=UPI0020BF8ED9|nr:TetR/AcrR family transcriptional regulator [Nocardioides sp. InS609-2]